MSSGIPLPALDVQRPEDPLQQYGKLIQMKALLQAQQQREALFPSQLQASRAQASQAAAQSQMTQLGLQNMQKVNSFLASPDSGQKLDQWQKMQGAQPQSAVQPDLGAGVQLSPIARYLNEVEGLPLLGPNGALEVNQKFTAAAQEMANLAKTQGDAGAALIKNHQQQLDNFNDLATPILEQANDPAAQAQGLQDLKTKVSADPASYPPLLVQNLGKLNDAGTLARFANTAKVQEMILDESLKQSQAKTQATAAATPTPQQLQAAIGTVQTYQSLPAYQRQALVNEMKQAPTYADLQTVQKRADDNAASFQRSADMRQQAMAMKDIATGQIIASKLVAQDQTLNAALANSAGIRDELNMTQGGNQVAGKAAMQRFAEHEVAEGGIKRFNELEQNMLTTGGATIMRKAQMWADTNFEGKPPEATNADIQSILDTEDRIARQQHDQMVNTIQQRYSGLMGQGAAANRGAAPPQNQQQHAPGAKAGLPDGTTGKGSDGKSYVVKGGVWVAQ
jgi:hypothetical protein